MSEEIAEIVCVLDKSGSMGATATDAIGGFNSFLKQQKELPNKALMTVTLFDDEYKIRHKSEELDKIDELDSTNYVPGGMTALLDAVGKTIDEVTEAHRQLPIDNVPSKTIMVIVTDGKENSSKEYKRDQILEMITKRREEGWEFVFLGADESAFSESASMGVKLTRAYTPDSQGVSQSYADMTSAVMSYRQTGNVDMGN